MESVSQPKKATSNIPIIVVVSIIVACCCSAITLCLCLGTGFFALSQTSTTNPPPIDLESFPTIIPEEPFESLPTESPSDLFIPTPATNEPFNPNLPQGGRGDNALRERVWDFVTSLAKDDADCNSPLPSATIIVETVKPDNSGVWEETWTLFCENGPTPVYRIIFTPNPDGNINFSPGLISK